VFADLCAIGWLILHDHEGLGMAGVRDGLSAALGGKEIRNIDDCWRGYVLWKGAMLVQEEEQRERTKMDMEKEREDVFVTGVTEKVEEVKDEAALREFGEQKVPQKRVEDLVYVQNSRILDEKMLKGLNAHLPSFVQRRQLTKVFEMGAGSTVQDLLAAGGGTGSALVLIRDEEDCVFGVFCDEGLANRGDIFFGSSRCFLFKRERGGEVEVWGGGRGKGRDGNYVICNEEFVGFGSDGVGGFGLYLDQDLSMGSSGGSVTYGNAGSIASSGDFLILGLEVFSFV